MYSGMLDSHSSRHRTESLIQKTMDTHLHIAGAWRSRSKVVFAYTTMSSVVNPAGWSDNFHLEFDSTVFFGEYMCSGLGSNPASRAKFTKHMNDAQVQPFVCLGFIQGSSWLLPPPNV
ncbi:putative pectinesterase 63 [Fagus crenata]